MEYINKLIENAYNNYCQAIDDFIDYCFLELGYEGDINNMDEVRHFIEDYGVEIIMEEYPEYQGHIITVSCRKLNYYNAKMFSFKFEVK